MQNFVREITLDLFQNKYVLMNISQYDIDSRELIIKITENGKFFYVDKNTMSARAKYIKSDNKKVINDCEILENGTIKVILTDQMATIDGKSELELILTDKKTMQVIHPTTHLIVNVIRSVFRDDEISSENEFIALESALAKADYLSRLRRITESEIDSLF